MTKLLQRAIAALKKLPEDEQDVIASRILADLKDEQAWSARFNQTTDDQWKRLAEQVRRDIVAGKTTPLDEVFPSETSTS